MNIHDILSRLEGMGDEKVRRQNSKQGDPGRQFGVRLGDIRKMAAEFKGQHELALELWDTGMLEARFLAVLLLNPKKLQSNDVERLAATATFGWLADWLNSYVIRKHADKEALRLKWMESDNSWLARAGWILTSERIAKHAADLDLPSLLDRIERDMPVAAPEQQWTMNFCLAYIGIHAPSHRARAIAIGEALGLYRDYPVSKGCTSPFAPIWIGEMVRRAEG